MKLIEALMNGDAQFEWAEILSKYDGNELKIFVFRDAMKFNGIREQATAYELQQMADALDCLLLTPKVVDFIWEQANTRFDSIVQADGGIVANSSSARVSQLIDQKIESLGGDQGGLIDSVGKYWVIINKLLRPGNLYGVKTACNYGWPSSVAARVSEITPKINGKPHMVWQNPGFKHGDNHHDPSQTIRLMHAYGLLKQKHETEFWKTSLTSVMTDPNLHHLLSHEGPLFCHRQPSVPMFQGFACYPLPAAIEAA